MTHRIKSVKPMENFVIEAVFMDGTVKQFDMRKLYPVFPQFKEFETIHGLFEEVKVDVGGYGISWNDELDLDAEDIWDDGLEICKEEVTDVNTALAENLSKARDASGLTQKQLSEKVGIYQADISKIERGIGNQSLSTLKRLADGMGMTLNIEFVPRATGK